MLLYNSKNSLINIVTRVMLAQMSKCAICIWLRTKYVIKNEIYVYKMGIEFSRAKITGITIFLYTDKQNFLKQNFSWIIR